MAFPPSPLPVNRTNATPQQNTHPADHNAIGQAVNDTVTQVVGLTNSLGLRTALWFKGVVHNDLIVIEVGLDTITTAANGVMNIPFPQAFAVPPVVIVNDAGAGNYLIAPQTPAVNFCTCMVRQADSTPSQAGTPVANTPVTVSWIAIGYRV